jgi:hypothetical protein
MSRLENIKDLEITCENWVSRGSKDDVLGLWGRVDLRVHTDYFFLLNVETTRRRCPDEHTQEIIWCYSLLQENYERWEKEDKKKVWEFPTLVVIATLFLYHFLGLRHTSLQSTVTCEIRQKTRHGDCPVAFRYYGYVRNSCINRKW